MADGRATGAFSRLTICHFPSAIFHRTAFTLIELLVTIGIISVLASLVFFAAAKMRVGAQESQCRSMLGGLTSVAAMYETSTSKPIEHLEINPFATYWTEQQHYNNGTSGTHIIQGGLSQDEKDANHTSAEDDRHERANLYIERFVWVTLQMPETRDRFAGLGDNAFVDLDGPDVNGDGVPDGDGFMEIRDPWGNCIAYANRTRHLYNSSSSPDPEDDFLPDQANPFFASAGADGKWGAAYIDSEMSASDWSSYQGSTNYADSRDNLYSFDIDRSSAETQR